MTALPKIAQFLAEHGMDHFQGAALFECSGEYVRQMCLPFDTARRRVPSSRLKARIAEKTAGVVGVDDWQPPLRIPVMGVAR